MALENPGDARFQQPGQVPPERIQQNEALAKIHDEIHDQPPPPQKFHGLNLGIIHIGVRGNHLDMGVNVGVAKADVTLGDENSVHVKAGLGPIVGAEAGVGVGVNKHGLHAGGGAGVHALELVGGGAEVGAKVGDALGGDVGAGAYLGPHHHRGHADVAVGAALGQTGLDAAVGAGVNAGDLAGVNAGGQLALGDNSKVGVDAEGNIGRFAGRTDVGVMSDYDSEIRPTVTVDGANGNRIGRIDVNSPDSQYNGGYDSGRPVAYDGYTPADQRRADAQSSQYRYDAQPAAPGDVPLPVYRPDASAPISEAPLPLARPADHVAVHPTQDQIDQHSRQDLQDAVHNSTYTVQKGDSYQKIAKNLLPEGSSQPDILKEAAKLQDLHQRNGFHSLQPGQKIATRGPYEIDEDVKQKTNAYASSDLQAPAAASAPITEAPLPPARPADHAAVAPTKEQVDAHSRQDLADEVHNSTYTVKKGDTWLSIAKSLVPEGSDRTAIYVEAAKLQDLHESNGYHDLKPGQKIATRSAYEIDADVQKKAAAYSTSDTSGS